MNEQSQNELVFSVVKADGEECNDVKFETIKEWYFNRQVNDSSLIFSPEIGKWQILEKVFNVAQLKTEYLSKFSSGTDNNYQDNSNFQNNSANQENSYNQNSYEPEPQNIPSQTQYHQTVETNFYPNHQENTTNQSNQGYQQNNQNNYANQANDASTPIYAQTAEQPVKAFRLAAIFLLTNLIIWIISTFILIFLELNKQTGASDEILAEQFGKEVGKELIKLLIDVYLASNLWKYTNYETNARMLTIIRTYIGAIIYVAFVIPYLSAGYYVAGFSVAGSIFVYAFGILVLLHGKTKPSQTRLRLGWISLFLFIVLTTVSLVSITPIISKGLENSAITADMKKYEIKSNEFVDANNVVKVKLPNGWTQFSTDAPFVESPMIKMIATNEQKLRYAKLTIVPFESDRSKTNFYITKALEEAYTNVENERKSNNKTYVTRANSAISFGDKLGRRVIYKETKKGDNKKSVGHMLYTMDYKAAYILEMWCYEDDYTSATNDFIFLESNFTFQNQK